MIGYVIDFIIICLVIWTLFKQGNIEYIQGTILQYIKKRDGKTGVEIARDALFGGEVKDEE